jgi:hypothetical protein
MLRSTPVQITVAPRQVRKAATVTAVIAPAARRGFSGLSEARVRGAVVAGTAVTSRVRDGLVLRVVGLKKSARVRSLVHGCGAR